MNQSYRVAIPEDKKIFSSTSEEKRTFASLVYALCVLYPQKKSTVGIYGVILIIVANPDKLRSKGNKEG